MLALVVLLMSASPANTATLHVPVEYPTIQAGIDAAVIGDTVFVSSGVYEELITMKSGVSLLGEDSATTIIDISGNQFPVYGVVISIPENVSDCTVSGFSLAGGKSAIHMSTPGPNITVSSNCLGPPRDVYGSGIGVVFGEVREYSASILITNNLIFGYNYAGINLQYSSPQIYNNTIVKNGEHGIWCYMSSNPTIRNNICANNGRAGVGVWTSQNQPANPSVSYNCTFNNAWGSYTNTNGDGFVPLPGTGNLITDPGFDSPDTGDYHLQPGSPCIDAGDPSNPGNIRYFGAAPDIGRYEYIPPGTLVGDPTGNGEVTPYDATLPLRYSVGLITLPDVDWPNFCPYTADVSGNDTVSAYDGALILQYSVALIPEFPVEQA